jgi:NTE family protein
MGEVPPRNLIFHDIRSKDRLQRFYYNERKKIAHVPPLGWAVAASAGVPGIFPPMPISYGKIRVLLVDGGVYDNQGIVGLLDPKPYMACTDFVVSDASGQADTEYYPSQDLLSVLSTSNEIISSRVREEMINHLLYSNPGRVAFFHLRRGIFAKEIDFNTGETSAMPGKKMRSGLVGSEEEFGISQVAQKALAQIRTDLDSFTDVEAGCLQACGYLMSEPRLIELENYVSPMQVNGKWQFERYISILKNDDRRSISQLKLGSNQFLKPYL